MIGQCLGGPIFTWGDQVPNETLDVLISTVVQQTVGQKGPADRLHIRLLQGALEATMSQDVTPPAPPEDPQVTKQFTHVNRNKSLTDLTNSIADYVQQRIYNFQFSQEKKFCQQRKIDTQFDKVKIYIKL